MKCLDTTYFIDLIRNPSLIKEITINLEDETLVTTVFNVYESFFGAYAVKSAEARAKIIDKLTKAFSRVEILDFTYKDSIRAAEIGGNLSKQGKYVGADAITAAIALNNGCNTIVTRNEEHFRWIGDLTSLKIMVY